MSEAARGQCAGCGAHWPRGGSCHCGALDGCHDTFADVRLFDAHRDHGHCLDPAEVDDRAGRPVMEWSGAMWVPARKVVGS